MLHRVLIENFIIIDKLDLEFNDNFTAITGETGTGKSIILDAIDFCFGKFSSKTIKKNPNEPCSVSINFKVKNFEKISKLLDINLKNDIIIKRVIDPNNKNICYLNDSQISGKILKDVMGYFVDITAQSDSILDAKSQRQTLDVFMVSVNPEISDDIKNISDLYNEISSIDKNIEKLEDEARAIRRDKEYYSQIVQDLRKIEILPDEETELLSKRSQISKLCASNNSIKSAIEILKSSGIENKLFQISKNLEKIDNEITIDIKKRTDSISLEISDISSELDSLISNMYAAESEMIEIDERLSIIRSLARKYNVAPSILYEFLTDAESKLDLSNNFEAEINNLITKRNETFSQYKISAEKLSNARKTAASEISGLVCERLKYLLMPNATFKIDVFKNDNLISQFGMDEIEFMANFNENSLLMPISKIASGGEAARLNFALKTVIGIYGKSNSIIFDEVDIGIGGAAAYSMGNAMKKLANDHKIQVISITHSPQVAARSDSHIVIKKHIEGSHINVTASKLNLESRVYEIARMISGDVINDDAISAAKQLF